MKDFFGYAELDSTVLKWQDSNRRIEGPLLGRFEP